MAESVETSGNFVNKTKELFGEKHLTGESRTSLQTDNEHFGKHKLYRQLSRSKSGRIKHRIRSYSTIADINFFPPTKEDENNETAVECFKNETQNKGIQNSVKDKIKTELEKNNSLKDVESFKTDPILVTYKL